MATVLNGSMAEQFLQAELRNDYSYSLGPGLDKEQYNFSHVSSQPPPSSYMRKVQATAGGVPGMPGTAIGGQSTDARPMTSNRSAGYQAPKPANAFDPLQQGDKASGTAGRVLQKKAEQTPEEKLREMEREIHKLVEESAMTREQGNNSLALEKAKEAQKKERALCRSREAQGLMEQLNVDLTYAVCLHLGLVQQADGNMEEAYNIYATIVKNKNYPFSGRFRVNMGNICYAQERYPTAIKMYRMALDQIPQNIQGVRHKIMRNIGNGFFAMGQFPDAADSYENLLGQEGQHLDFMTGFNLILCYYALGDKDKMKQGFQRLLAIQQVGLCDTEDETDEALSPGRDPVTGTKLSEDDALCEGEDALKEDVKNRQRQAARFILNGAQLVSPEIEKTPIQGFDWTIEALKKHGFPGIASEMEITKANYYLRRKEFDTAIAILKSFEKKDPSLMARAATNISFLYFLEGEWAQAERYADIAVKADRYNSKALVNKGNCLFVAGELDRAKEVYLEAIGVSADCLEAIYNLGIVNVHCGRNQDAMLAFDKIASITRTNCEVFWQMGNLYELCGNDAKAHEWFSLVITSPQGRASDAGVLSRIAQLYAKQDDESHAFHYHLESYRYWPVDLNVITWLGIHYVKQEMYESAIPFFQRAAEVQSAEAKWLLMVASCYRRMGSTAAALQLYEKIHRLFPQDQECLRYLVALCKELDLKSEHYSVKLRKLERIAEVEMQLHEPEMGGAYVEELPDDRGALGYGGPTTQMGMPSGGPTPEQQAPTFEADVDVPVAATKKRLIKKEKKEEEEEEMDWGDGDDDDLLPDL